MRLKGEKMAERLTNLQKEDSALNRYIKAHKERKEVNLRMTREEKLTLDNSVQGVLQVKKAVRREMAQAKIVDLGA